MSRLPREITTTLLLAIFNKGEVTMTQLQKETGFSTITVLNHIEELMTADLLEERRERELPKRRYLKLSKEGLRIASMLNLITSSMLDSKGFIDLGAKVGRMAAYREAATLLRQQNVTRDYAIAEFLVSDLELLTESLTIISNVLPPELRMGTEILKEMRVKLDTKAAEARKYLQNNDIRRSAETVAAAWKEYRGNPEGIERLSKNLKERKLEDLSKIIEFVVPKYTQKD
jgi:hypothetical protein